MPIITREEEIGLGLTPPAIGEENREPDRKVKRAKKDKFKRIFRTRLSLSDDKKLLVKKVLRQSWEEWDQNTSLLRSKLRRYNDLMEGIKEPKIFPWVDSSNLHMPVIEIHISILHSIASQTMLENEPIFYVKIMRDMTGDNVDTDVEQFLHWTCRINLKIDNDLSDIYWNTYRDGTGIGDLDWVEEYDRVYDIVTFRDIDLFVEQFPTPESAGISAKEYESLLKAILDEGEVQLKIEETRVKYRGPRLRVVELKDFIVIPTTAPSLEYAMFIGDAFIQRADYFRIKVRDDWFEKDETEKMLKTSGLTMAPDSISQSQDRIEGVGRNRVVKADEYYCMQGILKINLSDDETEPEKMYLVTYHRDTDCLLRMEEYPYIHNRIKYITWRFKKRSGRLLGQSLPDQIIDINEEIDTQHNQRVDSRTITTVPSFKRLESSSFDPTRRDQRFYPGVTFKVNNMNEMQQWDIKQTDMGQTMAEEQNLMVLADTRTGASQLRSGRDVSKDPRAPAKKIQIQLQQSGIRADDHMRELRIGTAELGSQILELYYQFAPDMISYPRRDPQTQQFVMAEVMRQKLRAKGLFLEVARTSVMDNPNAILQKELTLYELMMRNPLVAPNMLRIREVTHRLLKAMRERDVDKIIPPVDQLIKELQAQAGLNDPNQPPPVQEMGNQLMGKGGESPGPNHAKRMGEPPQRPKSPIPAIE